MNIPSSIDPEEISKFSQHKNVWWDAQGPLKTLHMINPTRLEYIQKHVSLAGKRVLDVGCGGGILTEALAKAGAQVQGLDADEAGIEAAMAHAKSSKLDIPYCCTSIETFEAEPFDVITCLEMLEHVTDPALVLQHCVRLLKPGGTLIVSTINRTAKAWVFAVVMAEYVLRLLPRQTHDFDKFIKPSELMSIARDCDLELLDMTGMEFNPLNGQSVLSKDISVNYLMCFKRV